MQLTTAGLTHAGSYDNLSTQFDGAYQFGKNNKRDVSAYLLSLQVFYKLDILKVGLGGDMISGSSGGAKGKYYTFETPYNATHRFLGYMDYSFKNASSKYLLGVNDIYLTSTVAPVNCAFNFGLNLHHLLTNKQDANGSTALGDEVDLTVKYEMIKGTTLTWGGSVFVPGNSLKTSYTTTKGNRNDAAFWSFVMLTANF